MALTRSKGVQLKNWAEQFCQREFINKIGGWEQCFIFSSSVLNNKHHAERKRREEREYTEQKSTTTLLPESHEFIE